MFIWYIDLQMVNKENIHLFTHIYTAMQFFQRHLEDITICINLEAHNDKTTLIVKITLLNYNYYHRNNMVLQRSSAVYITMYL